MKTDPGVDLYVNPVSRDGGVIIKIDLPREEEGEGGGGGLEDHKKRSLGAVRTDLNRKVKADSLIGRHGDSL